MRYKKIMILAILLVSLLAVSAVSAADNVTSDVASVENQEDNVITEVDNDLTSGVDDNILSTNPKTFTDLDTLINGNGCNDVYLDGNYIYNSKSDSNFKDGVAINREVTIHGNGYTIDGNNLARIFKTSYINVYFRDIVFVNGHATDGGAIQGDFSHSTAVNCTFINNLASEGGAIDGISFSAVNCTFINNRASYGGAMSHGSAVNCTFIGNSAGNTGGAKYNDDAVNCTFINNTANYGGAIFGCNDVNCTFIGNSANYNGGAIEQGTAMNCTFINNTAGEYGGAIIFILGDAVNCTFINNTAGKYGGAIEDGSAVNCTFINNSARDSGGAICVNKKFSVVNSTFQNNHAINNGGAIYVSRYGQCSVVNSTFQNNYAVNNGGVIYVDNGRRCSVVNSTFQNNYAVNNGGAIQGGSNYSTAVNCTFIGNHAVGGGAMSNISAVNCTFINNIADSKGGAMYGGSAVNCIFVNNDICNVDIVNCTFISSVETIITATGITTVYGVSKKLVATLKDVGGNILVGEQISIALNNVEYTVKTNSKGEASLTIPANLAPNTYVATITYAGNYEYYSSTTTADVVVQKAGTIISAVYNNDAGEIVATLTNANTGKAISSTNVKFNINGKTTSVKTNSKGQAKFSTADLPMGSTVKISYAGNSKYKSSSTSIVITAKSDIIISTVYDADNNELVATLTNADTENTVSGANVQVSFNGETKTLKTNTKGQVKVSTAGLPLGTYPATFSYAGNSKYNAASASINVEIKTKVIVTDVYAYSDKIVAKLTNGATGKTIANANMIVEINGVKYNAKSDNKGQLTFDTTGLDLPSAYDLTISYRGNDRYTASSATVAVDLNKANMMITTNYHADKQKMVATLKNSKTGKAVSNANMIIELNGVKTTYKSNDQGKITLPTADFAPGTYVGTVTYPGNARYNSISAVFKVDV